MENDRHLQFVLKHYREGAFDTSNAIDRFNRAAGRRNRGFIKYIAGVAAAAAVVLGIFIFNPKPQPVHIMTADATETFMLPDSTSVTLAPNSSLEYDARAYLRRSRSVTMEGKVFFDVTRNEKRPFEITASDAYVRVLGTSFEVDGTSSETEVYVKSGKVLFAADAEAEGIILTQGMEARLDSPDAVPVKVENPQPNPVAWATGLFEYESTPLENVLEELSAFYGISLTASDYNRRLSAKFETSSPVDAIVEMIATATSTKITISNHSASDAESPTGK